MPRRKAYRYYDDEYDSRSHRYRERRGCWYRLKRFAYGVVVTLICVLAAALVAGLALLAYVYRAYLGTVLVVVAALAGLILALLLLKFLIGVISTMVNAFSAMRVRAIEAGQAKVELSKRKLERDAYRQRVRQSQQLRPLPPPTQRAGSTVPLAQSPVGPTARPTVPLHEHQKSGVSAMPDMTTVYYRDVVQQVKPGKFVALIRKDGTVRIEPWSMFKILMVLGGSASGKTTTIAEKTLGFVSDAGLIIPCDPHESKEDSLFKKIAPLASALYPGATFAVDHVSILRNIHLVAAILQDRIEGGDCSIPVLLIVEELNRLLRDKAIAKEISLILETLGEEARGFNIHVLVGCQRVTGLADIRKAFISFIVHRSDETEAQHVIPARFAKYCSELAPGQCFVKDSNGHTEAGLQVLVTHRDMEQVGRRLSSYQPTPPQKRPTLPLDQRQQRRPTVPLDQRQQRTLHHPQPGQSVSPAPRRPTSPLSPSERIEKPQQKQPVRPVHRTRLQPVQRETEDFTQQTQNSLHTWTPQEEQEENQQAMKKVPPLLNLPQKTPVPVPPSPGAQIRDTEELSPSDGSREAQLELLARLRKKKTQK